MKKILALTLSIFLFSACSTTEECCQEPIKKTYRVKNYHTSYAGCPNCYCKEMVCEAPPKRVKRVVKERTFTPENYSSINCERKPYKDPSCEVRYVEPKREPVKEKVILFKTKTKEKAPACECTTTTTTTTTTCSSCPK